MIVSLFIFAAAAASIYAWNAASIYRAPAFARCSVSIADSRRYGDIAAAANGI